MMKVLYCRDRNKYVAITFTDISDGIINIKDIRYVDNLWEATILSKPNAVLLYNVLYKHSCYELSIEQIYNNAV